MARFPFIMRRIFSAGPSARWCRALLSVTMLAGGVVVPAEGWGASFSSSQETFDDSGSDSQDMPPPSVLMNGPPLPQPLQPEVAERGREVFEATRIGDITKAVKLSHISGIELLVPDMLAERYMSTNFTPSEEELTDWLHSYGHLPDAPLLRQRLNNLRHHGRKYESAPSIGYKAVTELQKVERGTPFSQGLNRNIRFEKKLMEKVGHSAAGVQSALDLIRETPGLSRAYAAQLYGDIAIKLLSQGDTSEAMRVGTAGFEKGQKIVGYPAFIGGLAAWREGQIDVAYSLFEAPANAKMTDPDVRSAAAFWAGRVVKRRHNMTLYHTWLHRAFEQSESFYGMLAGRILHESKPQQAGLSGVLPASEEAEVRTVLTEIDIDVVASMKEGQHLFALLQIGEQGRAEMLARQMWQEALVDPVHAHSLQLVVQRAGMLALSEQMRHALLSVNHQELKEVVGPLPNLNPQRGFRLSPALVYAVARKESNFDADATSSAGAYGMMQVRPITAGFVSKQYRLPQDISPSTGAHFMAVMSKKLREPGYNLEIGQLYMLYLAHNIYIGEQADGEARSSGGADLIKVLASYNAGPQAILHWERGQDGLEDPLMFIECLPSRETREYVRKVLANDWVYGRRLKAATPSLWALAEGKWPSFRMEEIVRDSPS